jgi:transcriptional regulator with PAS, ATPase and Fis domain
MFESLDDTLDSRSKIFAIYQVLSELVSPGMPSARRPWSASLPETPEAVALAETLLDEVRRRQTDPEDGRNLAADLAAALTHRVVSSPPGSGTALLEQLRAEFPLDDLMAGPIAVQARAITSAARSAKGMREALAPGDQSVEWSPQWREVLADAEQAASSDATVLVTGESGTGKEVVARRIHSLSPRADKRFVAVNCCGLPETLLESELFGHVKGSFTGAYRDKTGNLEAAHNGTAFLDEVGEMKLRLQEMLLRFLETGELQKVGADGRGPTVNVRVIASTNRNLRDMIAQGVFREDLYYRLNAIHIAVPPLRERRSDIIPLARAFLQELADERGSVRTISREAVELLMEYSWPGNVRELKNVLERAYIVSDGLIRVEHVRHLRKTAVKTGRFRFAKARSGELATAEAERSMIEAERSMIEAALKLRKYNRLRAAQDLGLSRVQLDQLMRTHGLKSPRS